MSCSSRPDDWVANPLLTALPLVLITHLLLVPHYHLQHYKPSDCIKNSIADKKL